jgi:hypothetical protein
MPTRALTIFESNRSQPLDLVVELSERICPVPDAKDFIPAEREPSASPIPSELEGSNGNDQIAIPEEIELFTSTAVIDLLKNAEAMKEEILNFSGMQLIHQQVRNMERWAKDLLDSSLRDDQVFEQLGGLKGAHVRLIEQYKSWYKTLEESGVTLPKIDTPWLFLPYDELYPPNWSKVIEYERLNDLLYVDGIPAVWVPPSDVLDNLLGATGRENRINILMEHSDRLLEDCLRIIGESTNQMLDGQRRLAVAAVRAWPQHPEAAQALAVIVSDTLIQKRYSRTFTKIYKSLPKKVKHDLNEVLLREIREVIALAPISVFLSKWHPQSSEPEPDELSRHRTIHGADSQHLNAENGLVAVLLMTSLLRTFNDAFEEPEAS